VHIHARLTRWRCRNDQCDRRIFADRLPGLAARLHAGPPLGWIVRLFGHSAVAAIRKTDGPARMTYGTVIVDLERRQVWTAADRSAATAADWFKGILRSRLSAAIALASMRMPRVRVHRRRADR